MKIVSITPSFQQCLNELSVDLFLNTHNYLRFTPKTPPYGRHYGSFTELLEKLVPSTTWEVIEFFDKENTHKTACVGLLGLEPKTFGL